MYVPGPGDVIAAIDAKTGDLVWEHRRKLPEGINGGTNRNIAMWGSTLIDGSADNQIYAVDVHTGNMVWETAVMEAKKRARSSAGPIIANGKVITGRQCQPDAGNDACIITAHDAQTGKEVWRTRTIPLPGRAGIRHLGRRADERAMARRHLDGAELRPGTEPDLRRHVGHDPRAQVHPRGQRPHVPLPQLDAGPRCRYRKIVWHYQHVVDHWDLDHPFERLLVETAIAPDPKEVAWINPTLKPGERRKVVTGIPGKTGVVYTLDRATGEFLWARPTIMQNVIKGIDGASGKVTVNPEAIFARMGDTKMICPGAQGGKNWPAGAYNPRTNVMYMPMQNLCGNFTPNTDKRDPSKVYGLDFPTIIAPGTDKVGAVWAIAVDTGKTLWKYEQRAGVLSLVSTGGGLIFGGDANGRFRAFDERSGKVLWETNLGAPVSGYPDHVLCRWEAVRVGRDRAVGRGDLDASRDAGAQAEHDRAGLRLRVAIDVVSGFSRTSTCLLSTTSSFTSASYARQGRAARTSTRWRPPSSCESILLTRR